MARRFSLFVFLCLVMAHVSASPHATEQGPTRVAPRPTQPVVRIVRASPPAACGEWGMITVESCRAVPSCDAREIGSSDVGPLSDALDSTLKTNLDRSCTGLSCGAPRTRNDSNNFACRGRAQLCMTRTLEYTCQRPASGTPPRATPQRTPPPSEPTQDARTGATRTPGGAATTPSAPPRSTDREPTQTTVVAGAAVRPPATGAASDLLEPEGGSGQRGMAPARVASSAATASPTARAARPPATRASSSAGYPFPARADELESGEYWYWKAPDGHGNGGQKYAYDLTTARFYESTGAWSECKADAAGKPKCGFCYNAAKNEDCLVYNEPLFAMASGVVERCWRNAPENPSPGESHPGRTSTPKRIGGGGNALVVRNDDGTYALYAHMKPGTIPTSLCPKTKALMDDAGDRSESEIPEGKRPRVAAGQFVGRVGNTGASSNPHLHVHLQDDGSKSADGVPLDFSGGFIVDADSDYEDAWVRLNGRTRPTATSAIWPNFSAGLPEVAYHGLSAPLYQRLFDHASASGYRLDWIDGFVVKGKTYFNVLFRPREGADWAASHNLTGSEYQQVVDTRRGQGMRIWHVDSYLVNNTVYYAAVFVKDGKTAAAYHGATQAEHQKKFDEWTADGWRPRSLSVTSVNGQRYYAATYERVSGPFLSRSALTGKEYQTLTTEQYAAGRQLSYLNAYVHDGDVYFSAIYVPASGGKKALHGLSGADYQREWEEARRASLLTQCVTGYVDGGTVRYAAAWAR